MPNLSIIVPVYNSKNYLGQCLNSIISQNYTDFEILLVDDGSTDGSGLLCDEYVLRDSRIRVFHKKNGGVSSARNVGLENAEGEWVMFVDSDDLLADTYAIKNLMQCVSNDVDMSFGGIRKIDNNNCDIEIIGTEAKKMTAEQCIDSFIHSPNYLGDWQRYLFNRVLNKSIINDYRLRFREDIFYKEDGLFLIQFLVRCTKTIISIPNVVYLYRQVPESAMNSLDISFNPKLFSLIDAHGEIYKELKKKDLPIIRRRELKHLFLNRKWILDKMKVTGSDNTFNRRLLTSKLIKNGGFFNYANYIVFQYYCKVLKESIARRVNLYLHK